MDVIPVIDVQHGLAVHATRGQRGAYRPLVTPLAAGSDPVAVARGLAALFTFPRLYVADLDGIEGRSANAELPSRLSAALPEVELWIDDGTSPQTVAQRLAASAATPVLGTESLRSAQDLTTMWTLPSDRYVLSLDFDQERFKGPCEALAETERWPDRVIVMTLARVGSGEGPDLKRIGEIVEAAGSRRVYAAGGVRDLRDVEALRRLGAAGVLVASALHANKITAGDLKAIADRR